MENVIKLPKPKTQVRCTSGPQEDCGGQVVRLFESKVYALSKLHSEMIFDTTPRTYWWLRSVRPFTQKFCKIVRHYHSLSIEELCESLNGHPDILKLKRLPGAHRFYPISTDLISDLENNIAKVIEYNPYGGGFLGIGAYGIPTLEVARTIAKICESSREFKRFEVWCSEYLQAESMEK